jgi:penicillin-binding protein 2
MSDPVAVSGEEIQMSTDEMRAAGLDPHSTSQPAPQAGPLRWRQLSLYGIVILVFVAFFWRLWDLQVVHRAEYVKKAAISQSKVVDLESPRGMIYDRAGTPLVRNIPSFTVVVVPIYLPGEELDDAERMQVYQKLSSLLNMPVTAASASAKLVGSAPGIKDIVDKAVKEGQYYREIPLKTDVPREIAMIIEEQKMKMPGVKLKVAGTRYYPLGPLASQILGYVGRVPAESVQSYKDNGYDPDIDQVGLTGIEGKFESYLRGTKGRKYFEEDAAGREVSIVGEPLQSVPGDNIYLSIDAGLQKVATDALQNEFDVINHAQGQEVTRRGAAIAMNPQTGQILAMVSLPTVDDNLFTQGISETAWNVISNDIHLPLVNHAIADQVPPGSIFKLIPASAALQEGVITPRTLINDPGSIVIPNKYYPNDPGQAKKLTCWLKTGHGNVDLLHGLAYSCDVYFWEVGAGYDVPNRPKFEGLGLDRLVNYSRWFGLGRMTNIDVPGEAAGHVPTRTWLRQVYGMSWPTGETYNFAIGQGYLLVTPLQMLNVTAAVANGGTLYRPQVVDHITDSNGNVVRAFKPRADAKVPVSLENIQLVQQGMEASVEWGTSTKAKVPGVRVAGKTGTAEFCDDLAQKLEFCAPGKSYPMHAWFVSFAPVDNPQIALIVYIWNGGEGSEHAAPVAKKMLDYFFASKAQPKP